MSTPKKNFIYNIIYQMLILIIPLILSPYLSRSLGANGIGIYSYKYSIVYYFMLFTLFGINNYGNRSIAKARDNKENLSKTFLSIYIFQLIMGLIMLIIYLTYIFVFDVSYKNIALILSLFILSSILDINWFFFGLEEFKKTITRNIIIKIINLILIFIFVKKPNDVWKYALIMSIMTCLSQLILWKFLKKKITFAKITKKDILMHIKPNLTLFIPVIAVSLYKMMDKVMIGYLINPKEVGFYENAEKIISIPLAFTTALGTVMLPRVSNLLVKGEKDKIKRYIGNSIKFVMFLSLPMCMGLISIGYNFAPIYFGNEFQKTGILIILLSVTLPFVSFANILRTQYLIPNEMDKIYIKSVILGAIINLILNFVFIPGLKSIGACIGTIAAEFTVYFIQMFELRKDLDIKKYHVSAVPFLLKAIVMFLIIYPLNYINCNNIIKIILQIGVGTIIYFTLNVKYIMTIIDIKKILIKLKIKSEVI